MNQFVSVAIFVLAVAGNALPQELQFGFRPVYSSQQFQRRQGFAAPQQQFRPSPQPQNQQFNRFRPIPQQQQFTRQPQNFAPAQGNVNQRPRVNSNRPLFRNNVGGLQPPRQVQQQTVATQFAPQQNFRSVAPVQQPQRFQQFQQPQNLPPPIPTPVVNTQAQAFVPLVTPNPTPLQPSPQPVRQVQQPLPPVQPQPAPQFTNANISPPAVAPLPQPAAFVAPAPASVAPQPALTTTAAVSLSPAVAPTPLPQPLPILPVSNQLVTAPLTAEVATTVALNNVTPAPPLTTRQPLRPVPQFPLALDGNNVEANAGVLPLQSETSNLELQFPKYPPFLKR